MAYADSWSTSDFPNGVTVENAAMSGDGQYCYIAVDDSTDSGIWVSNDYGHTWTRAVDLSSTSPDLPGIVCSSSGQYVYCAYDGSDPYGLYTSDDYGATWNFIDSTTLGFEPISGGNSFKIVACSSNGQIVYINGVDVSLGDGNTCIFKSTDAGSTWAIVYDDADSTISAQSLACDATGDVVFCLNIPDPPAYTSGLLSTNGGTSFAATTGLVMDQQIGWCNMSADGQVILARDNSDTLYYTLNQGSTWLTHVAADGISSSSVSANGLCFALGLFNFDIEVSSDAGSNWDTVTPGDPYGYWSAIAQNSDGSKLIAATSEAVYYSPGVSFTIDFITPNVGTTVGGTPVTITGTGFDPAATAAIDGNDLTNLVVADGTTITGITPAGTAGVVDVTVTNP